MPHSRSLVTGKNIQLDPWDTRIPEWDHHDVFERNCPICSSSPGRDRFIRPDYLSVRHCDVCGSWFIDPAPIEDQLSAFYSHYRKTYASGHMLSIEEVRDYYRIAATDYWDRNFIVKVLSTLVTLKGKYCLDIGCGIGCYLYLMNLHGCLSSGIEIDVDMIDLVNKSMGSECCTYATIFDMPDTFKYDIILMMDFIEHPLNPLDFIHKSKTLLNDNGLLVILTPNASHVKDDIQPALFRQDLEHMQYFSYLSLNYIAKTCGFSIVHLESYGFPYLSPPSNKSGGFKGYIKNSVKSLRFFHKVNAVRRSISRKKTPDPRSGRYELLCVLQNSHVSV